MRKITLWLMSTVAALVLLFSYRTSTDGGSGSAVAAAPPAVETSAAPSPGSTSTASPGPSASSSATSGSSSGSKTYTGSTASTRWGDVQVTITVTNGRITDVQVPVYPD